MFVKKKCPKCGVKMTRYVFDHEDESGAYEVGWKCPCCGYSEGVTVY